MQGTYWTIHKEVWRLRMGLGNKKELMEFFRKYIKLNPIQIEKPKIYPNAMKVTKKVTKYAGWLKIRRNTCCYFCGFDKVRHRHHLIPRVNGGSNIKNNLLTICPNHHWMIHYGEYDIRFWDGYYFLVHKDNDTDMVFPHPMQYGYKKVNPNIGWKKAIKRMEKSGALIIDKK